MVDPYYKSRRIRNAIKTARRLNSMLQGTFGLEGQGLPKETLKVMKRHSVTEILESGKQT